VGPEQPRVRLVVLNYNGGDLVVRAVQALTKLDWPADRLDLVVVDNASHDGSDRVVAERFPEVRVVHNATNMGFPGNNTGLRDLDGVDYVGLVNADSFVEPGWLRAMVAGLESDEGLGAVSARLLFADRYVAVDVRSPTFVPGTADHRELGVRVSGARVDHVDRWRDARFGPGAWGIEHDRSGGTFQWTGGDTTIRLPVPDEPGVVTGELRLSAETTKSVTLRSGDEEHVAMVGPQQGWAAVPLAGPPVDIVQNAGSIVFEDGYGADRGFQEPDEGQYDAPAEVFAWCGGSVLFRPAYLADVGLFDERFFMYYEDTDLAWRGRIRGWRYRYVPDAVVRHVHAAFTGEATPIFQHYVERNRLLMLVKDAPRDMAVRAVVRYVLITASYARRDLVRPLLGLHRPNPTQVRRRLGSFGGFLRLLPAMLVDRWRIRRRAKVGDGDLRAWFVPR